MAALSDSPPARRSAASRGALLGYAIPEFEAKLYESKLRDGNYLISVHTGGVVQQAHARDILAKNGATDVSATRRRRPSDAGTRAPSARSHPRPECAGS